LPGVKGIAYTTRAEAAGGRAAARLIAPAPGKERPLNEQLPKPPQSGGGIRARIDAEVRGSAGRRMLAIVLGVLALAAVAVALRYVGALVSSGGGLTPPPTPVVALEAGYDTFVDTIEAIGTARANESLVITAKMSETVRSINFTEGETVKQGAVLVELTSTTLRAPFTGVLGLRGVSPGELVNPGDKIVTLDDISLIKVDFSVPETYLSALAPGQEIVAKTAAYPDRTFAGIVRTIDTRVDPVTRALIVRAEIPNPESLLRPGMLMTVELIKNRRRSIVLPEETLVPMGERQFVFVVTDGKAEQRWVTLGSRRLGEVEILDGIAEGELVVREGTNRLSPGAAVRLVGAGGAGGAGGESSQAPQAASPKS
jgi:multidrug efflux pump subunit AcrA (membrane-fusion protein)